MSDKKPVPLVGRLAVQLKMISPAQLTEAIQSEGGSPRLGDAFVELGFIDAAQLTKLKQVQRDVIAKHRAKQAAAGGPAPAAAAPQKAPPPAASAPQQGSGPASEPAPPPVAPQLQRDLTSVADAPPARVPTPAADAPPPQRDLSSLADSPPAVAPMPAAPEPLEAPPAEPTPAPPAVAAPSAAAAAPPAARPAPASKPAAPVPAAEDDDTESLGLSVVDPTDDDRTRLHDLLRTAMESGASDVHIHSGAPIQLRVHGALAGMGDKPLGQEEVTRLISAALTPDERATLARCGELDLCYVLDGVGRFRANVYCQQRGFDAVLRTIPNQPPTLEQLGLPAELAKYTEYHQGMVLITGPAGCGKSSTMAALVNLINEEREEHILCVEDPVEYVHTSKRCFVNQRHAGRDTQSFARALRGALREDPDVIVIGELRDLETISLAMTAAETGHFVLATLHTNNAVRTINRMIGAFPSNQQGQVRTMLSESLRAVISQRLVPKADESGRVAALELLVINKAIANLIRDEKTVQIRSAIQTGAAQGMYLLEQSLNQLVSSGQIDRDVALALAEEKKLITG